MSAVPARCIQTPDGISLYQHDWPAPLGAPVQGGVVLMHGLGEHGARYAHVAAFFNALGWSVRAYDHRGHGRSGGARGDVPNMHALLDDAQLVIADFCGSDPRWSGPPLLFGHSMGGLFAARLACQTGIALRGLILSAPVMALTLTPVQALLARLMRRIAPGFGVSNGLNADFLSHDAALVKAYRADPYGQGRISARLLDAMQQTIKAVQLSGHAPGCPTLLLLPGDDRLVDTSGSEQFLTRVGTQHITVHRYPGLYHELFNEVDQQRVFDDLAAW
ncbi:MAG: lysophospholipase [Pseudomonadota bacterium]|nr:lysophospholipase [Pseudomonadota bacterium]